MKNKFNFNQKTLKFVHENNYEEENLVKSSCNNIAINFIEKWPNWPSDNRIVCIFGATGSGKTHLARVWKKKSNAKILNKINHLTLNYIYENNTPLVFEDINSNIYWPENLLFEFINEIKLSKNYLLITCKGDPYKIKWNLKDLISRFSSFVNIEIKLPDDSLIKNILVKQFSDRQFSIEKKLIEYISFRIERSYLAINNIVNLIDELTLKYKKPVSLSIIKEAISILDYKN
tara:strand:+ start:192 stop:887 length:696 start_codon:yes stop_codon:yes gene_type:complete